MNDENLTFLSASDFGTYRHALYGRLFGGPFADVGNLEFIPTDFVGLNSNIYDPVSSSTNFLGYPDGGLTGLSPAGANTWRYQGTFAVGAVNTTSDLPAAGALLNALILHRQGPYGWPSWKQVRVGNHPVNRVHRKNNIFSYAEKSSTNLPAYNFQENAKPGDYKLAEEFIAFNLTESCVSSKHKPLQHSFVVEQNGKLVNFNLKHSYGNLEEHYTNEKINIRLDFNGDFPEQFTKIYDDLKQIYIDKDFTFDLEQQSDEVKEANPYGMAVPFKKWVNMTYTEKLFPKQQNAFLIKSRQRTEYNQASGSDAINARDYRTFWRDAVADRGLRSPEVALNSQNYTTAEITSSWSLDTSIPIERPNARPTPIGELSTELGFHSEIETISGSYTETGSVNSFRFPTQHSASETQFLNQFARGVPNYATDLISGKRPFYDSYEDFAEDIRGLGKDYSILPEFRISDHMQFYVEEKEGNFLANNPSFLSLDGATITSSAATGQSLDGLNNNFFVEYSHTDFLKYFQQFAEDHQEDGEVKSYTFSMKGIKKLLPYRGFYPHQRALQLGSILSQSFGQFLTGNMNPDWTGALKSPSEIQTGALNAFLRPLIKPGITFNSLKSALAVDYPVFTGSIASGRVLLNATDAAGRAYWGENVIQNYRFPFEAVVEPQAYFPISSSKGDQNLFFDEPLEDFATNEAPNIAVSWYGDFSNLYPLAANNFFGEIPRFFLKDQKFTDFVSKPQSEFKTVKSGKYYYMDVVIKKTSDMVLWEGQLDAASAPYSGSNERGMFYGPPLSSSWANDQNGGNLKDPAYASYTPPYFYEDSIARVLYIPSSDGQPTLGDILANSQINTIYTGSFAGLGTNDAVSRTKMVVSASVNLFGRSRFKKVNYSTNIGPDGNYAPTSLEDTDASAFDAWSIGTKFECPALDFSASTDYHNTTTGRGLWGGYGSIPRGQTGVHFELRESFPDLIGTAASENTGSLIRLCGFKSAKKKIGKVAPSKTISEAIVAIPFTYETHKPGNATTIKYPNTLKKFFNVGIATYNSVFKQVQEGTAPEDVVVGPGGASSVSVADMIIKMQKYNIPPQLDFVTFPDLKPFAMYIFEFEHSLTQQDLVDIWQGLMPDISTRAQEDEAIITHQSGPFEFFKGKKLPETTRWMLFKVKRKAEKSYFAVTADAEDDQRFKFQFGNEEKPPEYNYNWPYDFFSLVELAKMEVDIEIAPKE
jgi:hypothetical protein